MNDGILVELVTDEGVKKLSVNRGIKVYEIADLYYDSSSGLRPIFATADGRVCDLLHELRHSCILRFYDMRSRLARLSYQKTVYFVFQAAMHEVRPDLRSAVRYPLNDGVLIEFNKEIDDATALAWKIDKRMREFIDLKTMFTRRVIKREDILSGKNCPASVSRRIKDLVATSDVREVFEYSCGSLSEIFFEPLMSGAGDIGIFQIVPYDGKMIIRVPHFGSPTKLRQYRDDKKLYESFDSVMKWNKLTGVNYIGDLNRKIRDGEWRDLILIEEANHEKNIAKIADTITKTHRRIILIAGPSASGKTTFAQRLCIQLRVNGLRPLYMGTDDYFRERCELIPDENGKLNFEDLSAVDIDLFNDQMNDLLAGMTVNIPVFDFIKGSKRYGERITRAERDQPIVIEGIHALNPKLTGGISDDNKFRIYISPLTTLNVDENNRIPVTDIRLIRRMARDMRSRARTAEQTLETWNDVRIGEEKNIFPFSGEADVLFNSTVSYELAVLRPLVENGLMDVKPGEEKYLEAQRILRLLRCVTPLRDLETISTNSIIREFTGGGIWVK